MLCELLNGVGQCVEELGVEVVSPDDLAAIFGIIHEQMTKFEHRREERLKANKDEEMDEEELEQMNELVEIETMVIARVSDCIHYSFQVRRLDSRWRALLARTTMRASESLMENIRYSSNRRKLNVIESSQWLH